jgi:serine/threonine protein phosphatase PrpC
MWECVRRPRPVHPRARVFLCCNRPLLTARVAHMLAVSYRPDMLLSHALASDDGHGGAQTSRFLRENSYAEFEKQLEKTRDPKQAFEKAWENLDNEYIEECLKNPRKAGLFAGSCALALYFDCVKNCLWVANLGDSRAVLGNVDESGWVETVEMTMDHRCARPELEPSL